MYERFLNKKNERGFTQICCSFNQLRAGKPTVVEINLPDEHIESKVEHNDPWTSF